MMMSKFYIFSLVFSIFLFSCSSADSDDVKTNGTQVEENSSMAKVPGSSNNQVDLNETGSTNGNAFYWIGLAMNASTKMVVSCLDIEGGALGLTKINDANQEVQEQLSKMQAYKKNNADTFVSDTNNQEFLNGYIEFADTSQKLFVKIKNNESLTVQTSYVAQVNKAYNKLGKIYGSIVQ